MKAAGERDDFVFLAAEVEPGKLDGRLVRFGPRVAKERLATEAALAQCLGPESLHLGMPGVGHMNERGHLLLHGPHDGLGTVTEQIAAPAWKEIEIAIPLAVPHVRTLAADQRHRIASVVADDVP